MFGSHHESRHESWAWLDCLLIVLLLPIGIMYVFIVLSNTISRIITVISNSM